MKDDDDRGIIRNLISSDWSNHPEHLEKWLKSTSEQKLRGLCIELDQIITESLDKVSRMNAAIKEHDKIYFLDEDELLAIQQIRTKIENELNKRPY
ncbi:hypothetical protein IAQ67_14590 [Paenibacillus peoriae]|uniref:Uncharacterized protein n=1 Tax=Paenibacillus peoriae TaxID=59893 RepID=A0A7H0Y235_9BACL|nr:hypothetical protein [Paenibacillus peoriae]QNR65143.1 hypothetical protein IAQ67_14590 [Paenibacillus peoriae]